LSRQRAGGPCPGQECGPVRWQQQGVCSSC